MDTTTTTQPQATEQEMCGPMAQPTDQHRWLQQFVGEWTIESTMSMPDGSSMTGSGTETYHALGELWVIGKMKAPMPDGTPMDARTTLGYNATRGTFEGSFVASCMDNMWVYTSGELSGNTLTLNCVGPSMAPGAEPGATANYQDIFELRDANTRTLRSQMETPDGWVQFMEATYTRVS